MQQAEAREGGFIVVHRRLRSSPLWLAMTGMERLVLLEVLFAANWKPTRIMHAGQWHVVNRGELIDSERTLASKAGVKRKVVRNAITKMLLDDGETGGNGPFLASRYIGAPSVLAVCSDEKKGPAKGPTRPPGLRVLTVRRYCEYQDVTPDRGPELDLKRAHRGAQEGPRKGPARARSEQVEQEEPGEPPPPPTPSWTPEQVAAAAAADPDGLWEWLQTARDRRGILREAHRPKTWTTWCRTQAAELLADVEPRIGYAYCLFLDDKTFAPKGWPSQVFMSPNVFTSRIPALINAPEKP